MLLRIQMQKQLVVVGVPSVLKELAHIKDYHLFKTKFGTYKITNGGGKTVANPVTEEQAWEKIRTLAGTAYIHPQCWDSCRIHDCINCDRYW